MKRIIGLLALSVLTGITHVVAYTGPETKKNAQRYTSHFENVLGTSMELKISATSERKATQAESAILKEISRMNHILSGYDAGSEFSQWQKTKGQAIAVSPELFEVLSLFDQWKTRTAGALDASAQVVSQLWKEAAKKQTLPAEAEIRTALAELNQVHWKLDYANHTATHLSSTPLVLNSFAKSYIIKQAADAAMAIKEVQSVLVNIGGDMVISGNLEETVRISDPKADAENDAPMDQIRVNNKAIATSGNYRRGEQINGKWYSHIIDPRTGQPANQVISATVVAPNATDAGALATAFNVLTPAQSKELAEALPGVEYLIITRNGDRFESKGWQLLEIPEEKNKPAENLVNIQKTDPVWNANFELAVNFEISTQANQWARRPFMAVWVEDKDNTPVRAITVWYNKPRWLADLRSWYRVYGSKFSGEAALLSSATSATRSPGKYTVKWDGRDDKGAFVKPGKYTIYIEAAREHGTYQLMKQDIECTDAAKQITIAGNPEVASASLEYRKKTTGN